MKSYDEYKSIIEPHLLDYIPQVDNKSYIIFESMKYSLMSGGKRLRPVLLLSACDYANGDIIEAMPYACALEFIHTYSLIHDDLPAMDDDDLRRNNPTNHKVFGEDIAILAGDGLLNTAFEVMFRASTYHFDDPVKLKRHVKAGLCISKEAGINGMIGGQVCDVENQYKECSLEMVKFIDEHKTGALIKAPIVAGLILSGADEHTIQKFTEYADCIGSAFQISDDLLDALGDEKVLGKKVGKDEENGKCSFVAINGIEKSKKVLNELTNSAISTISDLENDTSFFIELARKLEIRKA